MLIFKANANNATLDKMVFNVNFYLCYVYIHVQQQLHSYQSISYYNVLSPNSVHVGAS